VAANPWYLKSRVGRSLRCSQDFEKFQINRKRRTVTSFQAKWRSALFIGLFVLIATIAWHSAVAEDVVHAVSGIVKSVDKTTKTMVVKASDGTEHTIKWTDKTTVEGAKATGKGVADASAAMYEGAKEGTKVTVKYTEKGGEKTAVAIKDAGKATAKAVTQ